MSPILKEIIKKANLPFEGSGHSASHLVNLPEENELKSLCFFPKLLRVRVRRCYDADSDRKGIICTKRSTGHPTLTPGIFTMYCPHGL